MEIKKPKPDIMLPLHPLKNTPISGPKTTNEIQSIQLKCDDLQKVNASYNTKSSIPASISSPPVPAIQLSIDTMDGAVSFADQIQSIHWNTTTDNLIAQFLKLQILDLSQGQALQEMINSARSMLLASAHLLAKDECLEKAEELQEESDAYNNAYNKGKGRDPSLLKKSRRLARRARAIELSYINALIAVSMVRSGYAMYKTTERQQRMQNEITKEITQLLLETKPDKKASRHAFQEMDKARNQVAQALLKLIDERKQSLNGSHKELSI